jgi:hypothetical protein
MGRFLKLYGMIQKGCTKLCELINQVILRKRFLLIWVQFKSLAIYDISASDIHQTRIIST